MNQDLSKIHTLHLNHNSLLTDKCLILKKITFYFGTISHLLKVVKLVKRIPVFFSLPNINILWNDGKFVKGRNEH